MLNVVLTRVILDRQNTTYRRSFMIDDSNVQGTRRVWSFIGNLNDPVEVLLNSISETSFLEKRLTSIFFDHMLLFNPFFPTFSIEYGFEVNFFDFW